MTCDHGRDPSDCTDCVTEIDSRRRPVSRERAYQHIDHCRAVLRGERDELFP